MHHEGFKREKVKSQLDHNCSYMTFMIEGADRNEGRSVEERLSSSRVVIWINGARYASDLGA